MRHRHSQEVDKLVMILDEHKLRIAKLEAERNMLLTENHRLVLVESKRNAEEPVKVMELRREIDNFKKELASRQDALSASAAECEGLRNQLRMRSQNLVEITTSQRRAVEQMQKAQVMQTKLAEEKNEVARV